MLTISNSNIDIQDGLYSLNDLHRTSGGLKRHQPSNFIRRKQTQELITEIKTENFRSSEMRSLEPIRVVEGIQLDGAPQGTFVCYELVYSYAMWVSPRFHLLVIRAFHSIADQQNQLSQRLNDLCHDLQVVDTALTSAGRYLCVGGKQIKPQIQQDINSTLKQIQPSLFNVEEVRNEHR